MKSVGTCCTTGCTTVPNTVPNLFYGTGLAGCVLILRRKKPAKRKNKVLIIDASSLFRKGRAQNFLDPEHGDQIVKWFRAFEDVEDRAKVVTLDEIKQEDWTLNISRYVLPPIDEDIPPLPEAIASFKQALAEARDTEDHLRTVLTEGGWPRRTATHSPAAWSRALP